MKKEIPIYEIFIDLNDDQTTVSFNSLVSMPAHEKNFMTFSKQQRFEFNDEEQVITGIAISADTPIYRFDDQSKEEYYVVFTKQAIKDIIFDYARKDNFNNVNLEHNPNRIVKSIFMIHSYQIDHFKITFQEKQFLKMQAKKMISCHLKSINCTLKLKRMI